MLVKPRFKNYRKILYIDTFEISLSLYWNIVDLQFYVSFSCTVKGFSYICIYYFSNNFLIWLLQDIRDTKGTFHEKMGSIKDRNGMDLTEAEDIKRCQEYREELRKKDLHDPDNHDGVITHTHLEPDILECEVKWVLGSITMNKASGGDGNPVELFQILKDDAGKVLH